MFGCTAEYFSAGCFSCCAMSPEADFDIVSGVSDGAGAGSSGIRATGALTDFVTGVTDVMEASWGEGADGSNQAETHPSVHPISAPEKKSAAAAMRCARAVGAVVETLAGS